MSYLECPALVFCDLAELRVWSARVVVAGLSKAMTLARKNVALRTNLRPHSEAKDPKPLFDFYLMVDWSGGARRRGGGPDAI